MADLSQRQVGESYKDYAARMAGAARAAEIDRDAARSERDEARAELARRDTTIAAVRALCEDLQLESVTGGRTDAGSLWPSEVLELLPPVEAGTPACRYCGADCSDGRSWDGGDLYACPPCADARAGTPRTVLRCDRCGRTSEDWRKDLAAPVVYFTRQGLCHPCSRKAGAPAEPTGDTAQEAPDA